MNDRAIKHLERALVLGVSLVLLLMAVLTGVDVIGRYVLNAPVVGAAEVIALAMAVIIFAGLPLVSARREQITVDLSGTIFSGRAQRVQAVFVSMIGSLILAFLAYRLFILAGKMNASGDYTNMLHIPFAPLVYFMSGMSGVSSIVTILVGLRQTNMPSELPIE